MAQDLERFISACSTASGATQAGEYLRALFDKERVNQRTKIPSLVELAQAGVAVPGFSTEAKTQAAPVPGQTDPSAPRYTQGAAGPQESEPEPASAARAVPRRSGTSLLATGVLLGLLAFGGAFAALRYWPGTSRTPPSPPPDPVAVVPPPPPVAPPPVTPAPDPPDEAVPPQVEPAENPLPKPRRMERPIQLDAVSIQRVVTRGSGPILHCFETYKADLPADRGQVLVRFSILGSGKVTSAQTVGPLSGSRVATCLEQRVTRLQFPRHVDQEITLSAPFQYQVKR